MQLITTDVGGNVHAAAQWCNKVGLAGYVLQIDYVGSSGSIIVFKVRDVEAPVIREFLG